MIGKIQNKLQYWRRALGLIWSAAPRLTLSWSFLLIVQGVLPGLVILATKYIIDSFVEIKNAGGDFTQAYNVVAGILALGALLLLTEIAQYATEWVAVAQAEKVTDFIKDKIHTQSATLDIAFYDSPEYHNLMEQAKGESISKPLALLESLGAVGQSAITLLTMTLIIVNYSWWMPLLLLIGTLPALYIALVFDRVYFNWWKNSAKDRRWLTYYDTMLTHSEAAAEMRLFGLSQPFRNQFQNRRARLRKERLAHLSKQNYGRIAASFVALLTVGLAMGWMVYQILYFNKTLGDLVVFYQVFTRGQGLMRTALSSVSKTINNTLYLESLFQFFDLESSVASPAKPQKVPTNLRQGISIKDITFNYPESSNPAIRNFSLEIPAGKVVALVGVNGAGKSTLIKLLSRFYDPTEGRIEIDGVDLREFELEELRRMISILFQTPMQYHATAEENIAFGDATKDADKTEIETAAKRAGAHDFVSRLPQKYDTLLGKWFVNGAELSGGEWQRIALARAYFRRAPFVILDEPTSFMDSWAEADWFDRFRRMIAGRTSLIITHRFTIAMRADVIHVIDGGRIIESGTHYELVNADGFYAQSWKSQMQIAGEKSNNGNGQPNHLEKAV